MAPHRRTIIVLIFIAFLTTVAPPPAQAASSPAPDRQLTIWERIETIFSSGWLHFGEQIQARSGASVGGEGQEGNGEGESQQSEPNAGATIGGEGSNSGASVAGEG